MPPLKASFSWSTRREGNSGFVLETRPDGSQHEFGPLPASSVPSFVLARRYLVNYQMRLGGFLPDLDSDSPEPDYSYLKPEPEGPLR